MKLAAIDIGSNAIRFQVTHVMSYEAQHYFKRLEYVRFPLRLGQDVFKTKKIGTKSEEKFMRLMHAFKILIDLYEVDAYYACATSAMREGKNGGSICKKVNEQLGLEIEIISGEKEAELINRVVLEKLKNGTFLHIDVGGGSTELNLIIDGRTKESGSFAMGSVRGKMNSENDEETKRMKDWIATAKGNIRRTLTAVGTGGNINKLYELSPTKPKSRTLKITELETVQQQLRELSLEERIFKLHLNPDRADVILPASDIYLTAMQAAECQKIFVPDVGLKDGIMHMLFTQHLS